MSEVNNKEIKFKMSGYPVSTIISMIIYLILFILSMLLINNLIFRIITIICSIPILIFLFSLTKKTTFIINNECIKYIDRKNNINILLWKDVQEISSVSTGSESGISFSISILSNKKINMKNNKNRLNNNIKWLTQDHNLDYGIFLNDFDHFDKGKF